MTEEKQDGPAVFRIVGGVCLIMLALGVGAGFTLAGLSAAALARARVKATRTKCSNNLRQIGLAAIQYADDKRFFPHMSPISKLDHDGVTSPAGNDVPPRALRTLIYYNYIDNAESFVCPSSDDRPTTTAITDPRKFGWGGAPTTGGNPLWDPAPNDRDADALTDLSYGTTLRGLTCNSRSESVYAADRGREAEDVPEKHQPIHGNHDDGWNLVCIDGHAIYVDSSDPRSKELSSTQPTANGPAPALVVWDDANNGLPPPIPGGSRASHSASAGLILIGVGVILALALLAAGIIVLVMPKRKKVAAE